VKSAAPPIGVLLAAGRGRRMGGGKMLRPLPAPDGRPLVVAAFAVLARVCDRVVVIRGADGEAVAEALAAAAGAAAAADAATASIDFIEGDPAAPMLGSIRRGLRAARELDASAAVLLHPGDVPAPAPATVDAVIAAGRAAEAGEDPGRAVMPEVDGRGGHPAWLPPAAIDRVLALDDEHPGGLRAYWRGHPAFRIRLPLDDAGCRADVDTPADLRRAGDRAAAAPAAGAPEDVA
jgi:molybdenum cofactor cytidylyltransferase